jgi:hypothetical protein
VCGEKKEGEKAREDIEEGGKSTLHFTTPGKYVT